MSGKGSEARLTHGGDPRFRELVRAMDREYGERFGAAALKCRSCHGLDDIRQACLLLRDGQVVACGAFRAMEEGTAELNWVYVRPEHRRRGCARQVVEVLELQALFQGFGRMVMEIGRDIPEAISLYRKWDTGRSRLSPSLRTTRTPCAWKRSCCERRVQGRAPLEGKGVLEWLTGHWQMRYGPRPWMKWWGRSIF